MLSIFLISSIYAPVSASNVTITVEGQQVHATFALSLVQNVTALRNVTTTIDSASESNVSAAFTQALRSANPSASPSNLRLEVTSTRRNLNLTGTMDVVGVSQRNGDILSVNMTWLQFDVNSDLRAQNFSFNTVGIRYFRSVVAYYANASRFVARPNATITGATFFANGTSIGPPAAEDYVGNFTMLKFDSLNPDLGQWNRTYTLTNNTTTWRYFPSQLLNFDMRIQRKNATTDYVATYGYNATISVPGVGRAQGHILLADVGTGQTEWAMAAIVILAVASAIGVQILFRNRKKKLAKFQRK
jgi:uncharacterized membrane protein YcgQ (UPF0703/DUF1980 family)